MEWSKEEVARAFVQFYTSSSLAKPEEYQKKFERHLNQTGKDKFDADDIHMVMCRFVTTDFAGSLTPVIIGYLEENA